MKTLLAIALAALLMPSLASAQADCRPVAPADAATMHDWTALSGAGSMGACSDEGGTCFVIGTTWCVARADDEGEATGLLLTVPGGTILVIHWLYDHGGSSYWGGSATEVWRVDGAPMFVFSAITTYDEGEARMDGDDVDVCHVARTVQVDAAGVMLGARTMRGSCRAVIALLDRRGARPIAAPAVHWTWAQLGITPPPP